MTSNLAGKVVLITGGSRGIGRGIAEALLAEGAKVAICGRSQDSLDRAVQELSAKGEIVGATCTMGRNEEVEKLFAFVEQSFGGLDILVNNAGVGHFAPVHELGLDEWREVIDTNLSGVFYATRAAVPMMKKRGGGFILNIGSLAGKNPFPSGAAYNASKFGLSGMTEAMMMDLRYENIRVSQIMPGSVETEFRPGGSDNADWKLSVQQIADTAVHLLAMPERDLASRVEMRPSRPPRK